ncbi:hypothetical protein IGI04_029699 [Brassica rapa subsp. trilocularis]|uniref:Uncharacterized protein n=1 Tax=Brassica rapa subsp. trilocularis TaxID=1813537 RepID=A0ABQ7LNJ7_BRACM|nr:hypothetical protein IGI04_029699 [Brassica rapa subsp. trilocularis]
MANSRAFSDLKSGQCSSVVEARLLRFWEARNVKCGGEIKWMDLLMVDVKATMMQVTISSSQSDIYLILYVDVIGEILGVKIDSRHTAIELLTFLTLTENMDCKFYSTLSSVLQFTFRRPTTLSANKVNQLPV